MEFQRRIKTRSQVALAVFGRMLLVLSLWHAPFPVVHAHTMSLSQVGERSDLISHLLTFHQGSLKDALEKRETHLFSNWHMHVVFLPCAGCSEEHQQGEHSGQNSSLPGGEAPCWHMAVSKADRDLLQNHVEGYFRTSLELAHPAFHGEISSQRGPLTPEISSEFKPLAVGQGDRSVQELLSRQQC